MPQVVIDERFKGPPASANGGYTCGLLAEFIDGPAEVTLQSPPPLDRPLDVRLGDEDPWVTLWDGDTQVASGKPAGAEITVPPPVDLEAAHEAVERFPWHEGHPYPTCFVCGPERDEGDGLRVFAGPVADREVFASPWTPAPDLGGYGYAVRPEFVWAALDCPSGAAITAFGDIGEFLLGRLTAQLHAPVRVGSDHVVISWPIERDGRKMRTGSAVLDASGVVLAAAEAVWIELA